MEMSELREELERNLKASVAKRQSPEIANQEAQLSDKPADIDAAQVEISVVAPKSYRKKFAEDFKNLSPDWQQFLLEREKQIEKGFSEINNKITGYKVLEDIFAQNFERLSPQFAKARDWFAGLAKLDEAMFNHPAPTIKALANYYGVDVVFPKEKNVRASDEITFRISQLEQNFQDMKKYFDAEKQQQILDSLQFFGQQCDENGCFIHPYFNEVKEQMLSLLLNGYVRGCDEAYNQAVWLNPFVREKIIRKQIDNLAQNTQKSQDAAFAPKGKAEAPQKELTLREELEKNMAKFKH